VRGTGNPARVGRTSWWLRLSRKRRGIIAVSVLVLFFAGAIAGSVLAHAHHTARQCVDTRSMKVAASTHCQTGTDTTDAYRWYYGSAVTQVGGTARGGSFSNPDDDQGQSNRGGGAGDDDEGGSGGDEGGSGGGGAGDDG
jgi:uncharacterized membrane protein YgcG